MFFEAPMWGSLNAIAMRRFEFELPFDVQNN
jgi:hypothetical protein